jgi:hypothetical protein
MSKVIAEIRTELLTVQIVETIEQGWRVHTATVKINAGTVHQANLKDEIRFKASTEGRTVDVISVERPVYEDE